MIEEISTTEPLSPYHSNESNYEAKILTDSVSTKTVKVRSVLAPKCKLP